MADPTLKFEIPEHIKLVHIYTVMFSLAVDTSRKNNCSPYTQHQKGGTKEAALPVLFQGSLSLLGNTMKICLQKSIISNVIVSS